MHHRQNRRSASSAFNLSMLSRLHARLFGQVVIRPLLAL